MPCKITELESPNPAMMRIPGCPLRTEEEMRKFLLGAVQRKQSAVTHGHAFVQSRAVHAPPIITSQSLNPPIISFCQTLSAYSVPYFFITCQSHFNWYKCLGSLVYLFITVSLSLSSCVNTEFAYNILISFFEYNLINSHRS